MTTDVAGRYEAVLGRLRRAAEAAGRDPAGIRVVAVTKGVDLDVVQAASRAGITVFGESRVQEALPKIAAVPSAEWHLVGRLQGNKARRAVAAFSVIHSVDSLALLARLDRLAGEEGVAPTAFLEINVGGEATKAGFAGDAFDDARELDRLARAVRAVSNLRVAGLMTIAPAGASGDAARPYFRRVRHLSEALREASGLPLGELSMGMSLDAEAAVAEGATTVRIGRAIFGPRG